MNASDQSGLRLEPGPEGVQIYWKGRPLLGAHPVSGQSRRLPRQPQEQTLYLLQSPLLGQGADHFLHALPVNSASIFLEFEPALAVLKDHPAAIKTGVAGRWVTDKGSFGQTAHEFIRRRGIRRVCSLTLSGAARLYRDSYGHCVEEAGKLVQTYWNNRGTEIRLGRRWMANIWKNVAADITDLSSLKPNSSGVAFLIGAGPSLDASLSFIRKVRMAGIPLVAVDTALPSLAAAKIQVDIIIALDGQLANVADFMPWQWDRAFLIADVSTHHSIVNAFPKRHRHLICTRFSDLSIFDSNLVTGLTQFSPRGSVAPMAVEILHRLFGITEIVGTGFDFWYRLPRTHASLTMHHRKVLATANRLDGNDGPASRIDRPWKQGVLEDETPTVVDEILARQADQFVNVIATILEKDPRLRFSRLPGRGLFAGGTRLSWEEAELWVQTHSADPAGSEESRIESSGHDPGKRLQSLMELYNRLIIQEEVLADPNRPFYLDATLDFAWFDMPQWPLLALKREWAELHRSRLLQAVRDHRRRVQRGLLAAGVTLPDSL